MNMRVVLPVLCLIGIAQATPPRNATLDTFLPQAGDDGTPLEVAVNSGSGFRRRYYAASDGGTTVWVRTYDTDGVLVSGPTDAGADISSLNYNLNTEMLEVVQSGDADLRLAELDSDGNWVDASTSGGVIIHKPHSQSMPVYDAASDCFYSYAASGSTSLSVTSRATGLITGTIELDLASAGIPATNLTSFSCGFIGQMNWIVVFDAVNDDAVVFDTSGNFCGTSNLFTDVEHSLPCGSTLDQIFVFDRARNGWQGYRLTNFCNDPNECGDWDDDGDSDGDDFFAYLDAFARRDPCADLDGCGSVDGDDFFSFLDHFVNSCP